MHILHPYCHPHGCDHWDTPKKHQPGKWRLIADLSYPEGKSVNDAIDKRLCSLSLVSMQDMATTELLHLVREIGANFKGIVHFVIKAETCT